MRSPGARALALLCLAAAGCAELAGIDPWSPRSDADADAAPGATGVGAAGSSADATSTSTGSGGGGAGGCESTSQDCCGVDCLGGECVEGECAPLLLAEGSDVMRHLVVDASHVYFTEGGNIRRLPTSATGTVAPQSFADDADADFLAVDNTDVYWTVFATPSGSVNRRSKTQPETVTIAADESYPIGLSLLGPNVYWVRYQAGTLHAAARIGGGAVATLANTGAHPFSTANDGSDLWWTFKGLPPAEGIAAGGVRRFGDPPQDVADEQAGPTGLALDATSVYWFGDDASVRRAPKSGGAQETVAGAEAKSGTVFAGEVLVDDTHVYWTGLDPCDATPCPRILRVGKQGGDPQTFAQGAWVAINGIALGPGALYWTTNDSRLFRKVTGARASAARSR